MRLFFNRTKWTSRGPIISIAGPSGSLHYIQKRILFFENGGQPTSASFCCCQRIAYHQNNKKSSVISIYEVYFGGKTVSSTFQQIMNTMLTSLWRATRIICSWMRNNIQITRADLIFTFRRYILIWYDPIMGPHVSEWGRCANKTVERKALKRCTFSPDDPKQAWS